MAAKKIKVHDLKPKKDAKGGVFPPGTPTTHGPKGNPPTSHGPKPNLKTP